MRAQCTKSTGHKEVIKSFFFFTYFSHLLIWLLSIAFQEIWAFNVSFSQTTLFNFKPFTFFFHASGEVRAGNALNGVNAQNAEILKKNIEKHRKANVVSWASSSPSIKPFSLTESAVHWEKYRNNVVIKFVVKLKKNLRFCTDFYFVWNRKIIVYYALDMIKWALK